MNKPLRETLLNKQQFGDFGKTLEKWQKAWNSKKAKDLKEYTKQLPQPIQKCKDYLDGFNAPEPPDIVKLRNVLTAIAYRVAVVMQSVG
jgi:hypothetical protein